MYRTRKLRLRTGLLYGLVLICIMMPGISPAFIFHLLNKNKMNTLHEKLVKYEAKREMTDAEIFQSLTGIMMPENISLSDLYNASPLQLSELGLTIRQSAVIIAAQEFSFRIQRNPKSKVKITSPQDIYKYMNRFIGELSEEYFYIAHLNRRNEVIGTDCICTGSAVGTVVDIKQIARKALAFKSEGIILAHNHPSGSIDPSKADIDITKKLKNALENLDIKVVDHVIVGDNNYYSFAENGYL